MLLSRYIQYNETLWDLSTIDKKNSFNITFRYLSAFHGAPGDEQGGGARGGGGGGGGGPSDSGRDQ
jgi:hypothetical protein